MFDPQPGPWTNPNRPDIEFAATVLDQARLNELAQEAANQQEFDARANAEALQRLDSVFARKGRPVGHVDDIPWVAAEDVDWDRVTVISTPPVGDPPPSSSGNGSNASQGPPADAAEPRERPERPRGDDWLFVEDEDVRVRDWRPGSYRIKFY